jgi:hypothetical protein
MTKDKEIEVRDIQRLLLRVYRRYQSGAITYLQAYKETSLLTSMLKTIDVMSRTGETNRDPIIIQVHPDL